MTRRLFHTKDRGAVVPIVALLLPVLMVMTAFAVDLGRQRSSRRDMQAAADVIALDMARLADGRVLSEIAAGAPDAETALVESAGRNDVDRAQLTLVWGVWEEDTGTFDDVTDDSTPPNAAQIIATETTDYGFQPGSGDVTRSAIAVSTAEGVFSVGSRLLGLDTAESELLNPLLDVLLHGLGPTPTDPSGVSLDAVSYEALVGADIDINELLGILEADLVAAGVEVASPQQVLETEVTLLHIIQASADALAASGEGVDLEAAAILDLLALNIDPSITLEVGELLGAFVSEPGAVIGAEVNAFDLLLVGAQVVNGENLAAADLELPTAPFQDIPLVGNILEPSVEVSVSLIDPPQIGRGVPGDPSAFAETSQVRVGAHVGLVLNVDVGSRSRFSVLPSLAKVTLDLPLAVTAGNGRATLTDVDCPGDPTMRRLGLDVETGIASVEVGTSSSPLATVELGGEQVAKITLGAGVRVGDAHVQPLTLPIGDTGQVVAGELGLRDLLSVHLRATLLGFSFDRGLVSDLVDLLVEDVLGRVLGLVDRVLLSPLLDLLGAGVASADVKAIDARCGMPKLVD